MTRWPGFTVASLKKHQELIPLFASVGFGMALCGAYLGRLILKNPDVAWMRHSNPEPWNKHVQTKKYKMAADNIRNTYANV